jgi:hypothetical protein
MSGGSHNYIANEINEALFEDCFGNRVDNRYKNVCDEKTARIARNLNPMHDRELSELMADVMCLLHGLEWFDSCDIGEETYKECVNKFKAKWMHRTENDRLNSYLKDLKGYYESCYEELVEELKEKEND